MAKTRKGSLKDDDVVTSDENTIRFPNKTTNKTANNTNVAATANNNTNQTRAAGINWRWHLSIIAIGVFLSFTPVWMNLNYARMLEKVKDRLDWGEANNPAVGCLAKGLKVYTKADLLKHTKASERIWLGFLGEVFDVTEGKFYHPGGAYAFFAGVDGTRAFLSGHFIKAELIDDITDLDDSYLQGLETWLNMYHEKYKHLGYVIGAYYDKNACPTDKLAIIKQKLSKLKEKEQENEDEKNRYPPCNSEWASVENRGRLWCTTLSGGITRSWAGQPRMFYELNHKKWRCACIRSEQDEEDLCPGRTPTTLKKSKAGVDYDDDDGKSVQCRLKYYADCNPKQSECFLQD